MKNLLLSFKNYGKKNFPPYVGWKTADARIETTLISPHLKLAKHFTFVSCCFSSNSQEKD